MATTGSSNGSTTTGGTGVGGGQPTQAVPLVLESDVADGLLSLSTAGAFRIQSTAASLWQWSTWLDLANASGENLASTLPGVDYQITSLLLTPGWVTLDNSNWFSAEDGTLVGITVTDQTPVRVIVDAKIAYKLAGIQVEEVQTVYASGRVAVKTVTTNTLSTAQSLGAVEYNYLSVNPHLANGANAWMKTTYNNIAAGFLRVDGASPKSSLLGIDENNDQSISEDAATNFYWGDGTQVNLAAGGSAETNGEFQLGPDDQSGSSHVSRASDVLASATGLSIVSGAAPVGNGFDVRTASYVMKAGPSATQIVFGPSPDVDRYSPIFTVQSFAHPNWRLTLGGQEVVSSAKPIGTTALAYYDASAQSLVIAMVGRFDQGAAAETRTFTLEVM